LNKTPPELSLAERLAPLQRFGDTTYLDSAWQNYATLRYREVAGIVRALFDNRAAHATITVFDYNCLSGATFRALEETLGPQRTFRFVGVDSDIRAGGFLRARMPVVEFHEADLLRLEELAADGLAADICIAMCRLYAEDEETSRRVITAFASIAPLVIVADQIDNADGTSSARLQLTDDSGRDYEAVCHPFASWLAAAGYRAVETRPSAQPYKSISGYVVASKAESLPVAAIAAGIETATAAGNEAMLVRSVAFGPLMSATLRADKLTCMDIGAAGGVHALWKPYGEFIEVDAFEPDNAACQRAAAASPPFVTWHPVALGRTTGRQPFYVLRASTGSSFYPPNDEIQQFLNDTAYRRLEGVVDIETVTIPDFLRRFNRPMPNLLKLDTQGSELDILQAIDDPAWSEVLSIEVEVEFIEVYKGQPVFGDVDRFLRSKGMLLFDLRTAREYCCAHDDPAHYMKKYYGFDHGRQDMSARLYAGDALYIRDAFSQPPRTRAFLLKLIATLLVYLYFDYAMYFCDRGVELGLIEEQERDQLIEEIVAGTPKERPAEHVYQAFWQVRGWPNQ
jgi:FkbM family methyltransferase